MSQLVQMPSIQAVHAALLREVLAEGEGGTWAVYARGWLDGRLQSGALPDPVFERPASVMDFVRDGQAGATHAARSQDEARYARARGLEDAAWAAEFLTLDKPEKARVFVISACRRLGIAFERVVR